MAPAMGDSLALFRSVVPSFTHLLAYVKNRHIGSRAN